MISDDELLGQFCRGDVGAFAHLYERHHRTVFHLARLMLRNAATAEEVLQETFLSLARSAGDYRPRGQFRAWLLTICRHCCLNRIEYLQLRRADSIASVDEAMLQAPLQLSPDVSAENREQLAIVEEGLALLPPRQREAVLIYAMDDMDYRQIAQVMDIPVNTVKTLIHRGRAQLEEFLAQRNGSGQHE